MLEFPKILLTCLRATISGRPLAWGLLPFWSYRKEGNGNGWIHRSRLQIAMRFSLSFLADLVGYKGMAARGLWGRQPFVRDPEQKVMTYQMLSNFSLQPLLSLSWILFWMWISWEV